MREENRFNQIATAPLFLSVMMVGRALLQIRLHQQGFVSVSADEFARGLRALTWSQNPRISLLADLSNPWPPFEMYLNGVMLIILDDVLITPRITVFIASCLLLVALFLLIRHLFSSNVVAALAVTFVAMHPWYIWLSGTPMLEMYFLACFVCGLYFLVLWLRRRRRFYWLYAGLFFFLASGFHIQSWVLINLVNLFTCLFFYQFVKQKQYALVWQLTLFWLMGNAFILFWGVFEYATKGQIFGILTSHTQYSLWFYQGYYVPVLTKLLYYPDIVWRNIPLVAWLLGGVGLIFVLRVPDRLWRLMPLALGGFTLALASIFNLTSGPPSAAPDRYSVLYVLLLAPYVAYGFYSLVQPVWQMKYRQLTWPLAALTAGLSMLTLAQGVERANNFPQGMSIDTVRTGRYLSETLAAPHLSRPPLQPQETLMIEARYWDHLALRLMVQKDEKLVYDREHDYLNRDNPSLFLEDAAIVKTRLMQDRVGLVALREPLLKGKAEILPFLIRQNEIGDWIIFRVVTAP